MDEINTEQNLTEKQIKKIVSEYLESFGLSVAVINPKKLSPGQKSPDLEVNQNDKTIFYAEIKSPKPRLNPETQTYNWSTYSKISGLIHKAIKQLRSYDSSHKVPHIIIFTSTNSQLNWTNLKHTIDESVSNNETQINDVNKDIKRIDGFIWLQINPESQKIYEIKTFVNEESKFKTKLIEITDKFKDL
jgi:hypothetical protein